MTRPRHRAPRVFTRRAPSVCTRRTAFKLLAAILRRDADALQGVALDTPDLWRELIPQADFHQVVPALSGALKALNVTEQAPADVMELLDAVRELNQSRNEEVQAQGLKVLEILDDSGICALPLKGFAYLLTGIYADDPGMRQMVDIDILVSGEAAQPAFDALLAAGYSPQPDWPMENHHHLVPLVPDPQIHGPCTIEIHHRLGAEKYSGLLPAKEILSAAVKLELADQTITMPRNRDLLDHAVVHSALQNNHAAWRRMRLRDAFDISRLWQRENSRAGRHPDPRVLQHHLASRFLGACLLLAGISEHEIGALAKPGRRHLAQTLLLQSVSERVYRSIGDKTRELRYEPLSFASKFLELTRCRNLFRSSGCRRT